MKPIGFALVLGVALLAGIVGAGTIAVIGWQRVETTASAASPREVKAVVTQPLTARSQAMLSDDALAELEGLRLKVADLERDVADLRVDLSRRAAPAAVELSAAAAPQTATVVQRDAVVQILEEERQRESQKREEERKQRETQMYAQLAERAAKDLGLSPADQAKLVEFMDTSSAKRDELFRGLRDGGTPEGFRTAMEDFRTWRETELQATFGADLAKQLSDYTRGGRDGGFGMGFGGPGGEGGFGGGGGSQGGAQGARQGGRRGGGGGN